MSSQTYFPETAKWKAGIVGCKDLVEGRDLLSSSCANLIARPKPMKWVQNSGGDEAFRIRVSNILSLPIFFYKGARDLSELYMLIESSA